MMRKRGSKGWNTGKREKIRLFSRISVYMLCLFILFFTVPLPTDERSIHLPQCLFTAWAATSKEVPKSSPDNTQMVVTVGKDADADINLPGELMKNMKMISVILPASVDFVVRINNDGSFRQLYTPQNLYVTNHSEMDVTISLTDVQDSEAKLQNFDLRLTAYTADRDNRQVFLSEPLENGPYTGLTIAKLGADTKQPEQTNNCIRIDLLGGVNAQNSVVGFNGERFIFGTTFKISLDTKSS